VDKDTLVENGQKLVTLLDSTRVAPRVAIWIEVPETGNWRLWLVPKKTLTDKAEFYHILAKTISENRDKLRSLDVGMIDMKVESDPAIKALSAMMRMTGLGSAFLGSNSVNGIYLPDGIALRIDL
jgi:hypothetical protein